MKRILLFLFSLVTVWNCYAQDITPVQVMILPDDIYCNKHGFMTDGVPDYQKALLNDQMLSNVLNKVGALIQERDPEQKSIRLIDLNTAINNAKQSEMTGIAYDADDSESIQEAIIRASEAHVTIKVDFNIQPQGPSKYMHIGINAYDAFTNGTMSKADGNSSPSTSADAATLVNEAIFAKMDGFLEQLFVNYRSWYTIGRPMRIEVRTASGGKYDLRSKVGDGMVYEHIEDYLYDHAQNHRGASATNSSAKACTFPSVYFPMRMEGRRGRIEETNADRVGRNIQTHLESNGIESTYFPKGPGHLVVIVK